MNSKNDPSEIFNEERRLRCLEITSRLNLSIPDVGTFVLISACIERYVKTNELPAHKGHRIPVDEAIELAFKQCEEEIDKSEYPSDHGYPLERNVKNS